MAEPNVYDLADQYRAALLRRERAAASGLVRAYGDIWQRLKGRLDALTQQIQDARASGEVVSPAWLFQQGRLQALQQQVEAEVRSFAVAAGGSITAEQAAAVAAGQDNAAALMRAGIGTPPPGSGVAVAEVAATFARLPAGALTDLVGFLQDGSPLSAVLDELGPDAGAALRQTLITGLASGQGPRAIVSSVRAALGSNLTRALTIARTETLRAYRESSRRTYEANSDVVEGWVWHGATDRRSCAFCWAMHGTVHRVTERFASHPNCRCSPIPRTKSWEDLGFRGIPDTRPGIARGADLFARLPEAEQLAVLGPAKLAAYRAGALRLDDLAGFRNDPRWGPVGYERSLRDALGAAPARAYGLVGRLAPIAGGTLTPADNLILQAATGARALTEAELQDVLRHVARAGFDPNAVERAGGRLAGLSWQGRTLRGADMLPPADVHYLRHVVARQEWPVGTTLQDYLTSIGQSIRDPSARVFTSQYGQRGWHLGVVAPSGNWRGPAGGDWILVEYRVNTGQWATAYQLAVPDPRPELEQQAQRSSVRWLREP